MKKIPINNIIILLAVLIISACVRKETVDKTKEISSAATHAVIITPVPSLIPTATISEMMKVIDENLATNNGCDLPCIWKFTAGKTTLQEIKDYFYKLGWKVSERQIKNGEIYYTGQDIDEELTIDIGFYFEQMELELILYGLTHPKLDTRDQILSPSALMKQQGIPDQVWVNIYLSGEKSLDIIEYGGFDVYLYYQDPSFFIRYNGYAPHEKNSFKLCLMSEDDKNKEIDSIIENIQFYVGNENKVRTPKQIMELIDAPFTDRVNVEEAFQMTPQEFYEFIIDEENQPCFTTEDEMWQK